MSANLGCLLNNSDVEPPIASESGLGTSLARAALMSDSSGCSASVNRLGTDAAESGFCASEPADVGSGGGGGDGSAVGAALCAEALT